MALHLEYVRFLFEDMKNKQQALDELQKISTSRATFAEQFHIYRYRWVILSINYFINRRIIKEELLHGENTGKLSVSGAVGRAIEYDKYFAQMRRKVEKTAVYKMEFTAMLLEPYPGTYFKLNS